MRPDFDHYFNGMAQVAATRATCTRLKVGAVLVTDNQVAATGYNGSAPGMPHCEEAGCDVVDNHCVRTVHAEMNALAQAARRGVKIEGSTVYTTASPCWDCFRVLVNAGVKRFVYAMDYRANASQERIQAILAANPDITVEKLDG